MKIEYWEVREDTDERSSRVVGTYLNEDVARYVASKTKGWYDSPNRAGRMVLEIDETTDKDEAFKNYLRNTRGYKDYLDAKKTVETLEKIYGEL